MPKALITGITGQDGSYLAELLLAKGYEVHGMMRRSSSFNTGRIDHIYDKLHLHHGDMTDAHCLSALVRAVKPDEVYNLAAQSHVGVSFGAPAYTMEATGVGTLRLLEAVRDHAPKARFYQASSSEMFGNALTEVQDESTPFHPCSPYACAKVYAHHATVNYREAYGMHASCGILFNHESPRRGETFVTRKITRAVAAIKAGKQGGLELGNLEAIRDWGYAGDYVEVMWLMLQQDEPGDYVVATGVSTSVREFAEMAFSIAGLHWTLHVCASERYRRPSDVHSLCGDASRAHRILGWTPQVSVRNLASMMVLADMKEAGL